MIAISREWAPHAFDRLVERAVADIGLSGLDCVKYRESRLERWRELVGFFESREHAEAAISAAIRRELEHLFGIRPAPINDPPLTVDEKQSSVDNEWTSGQGRNTCLAAGMRRTSPP
jgi:hypothetical protein